MTECKHIEATSNFGLNDAVQILSNICVYNRYKFVEDDESMDQRWELSKKYVLGKGLELGALHRPLSVHKCVQVIYIDRINVDTAYNVHYPELKGDKLTNVDVIDDGEKLSNIPPESQDFIIANHFIEHTENPINTIKVHLSRIKTGGVLYYVIPDKRKTFDVERPITSFDHVLCDYQQGPDVSRDSHFYEWAGLVDHIPKDQIENRVKTLKDMGYSIHFHVWDANALRDFLEKTNEVLGHPFVIVEFVENGEENIVILRKIGSVIKPLDKNLEPDTPLALRVLLQVYEERQDLQNAFPEVKKDSNLSGLVEWTKKHGTKEDLRLFRFAPFYESQNIGWHKIFKKS